MSALMEKMGHEVEVAENGSDAWKIYDRKPFQLIISDWSMPEMDGLELCKKVRSRPETSYTYFILLTSKSKKENYLQAMMAQVDDFLTKPLDQDELMIRLWVASRILGYTTRIQQLEDILPVCSYCKKVRDEKNDWCDLDRYLARQGKMSLSHGICPECYQRHAKPAISKLKKAARE